MPSQKEQLVVVGREKLGLPFLHHFKPNACKGGLLVLDSCLESGLDSRGFDCTGFVLASLCEVLDVKQNSWIREFRHNYQLEKFADKDEAEYGDVLLIESYSEITGRPYITHTGVYVSIGQLIHANGKTGIIDESEVMGVVTDTRAIDSGALLSHMRQASERP